MRRHGKHMKWKYRRLLLWRRCHEVTDEVSRLKPGTDSKVRCALRRKDLITRCGGSFSRGEAKAFLMR